jgi:tRNA nucleotidyltransferase/poly(A) polymerase
MADYIYTMEIRLTPDQLKVVSLVQEAARAHGMNVYLTGGAIRDILTGLPIRDLDFTVQGNALKLQRDLELAGARVQIVSEESKTLHALMPGMVRVEISMARAETYDKPGTPPQIAPATINEDLRRRDFTVNAIALSLNPGSRGLLLDPFNGSADVEAKLIRILHNYAFLEEPSRLIRATRFAARFHWELEERTRARYDSARENNYIEYITPAAIGYEIEQLAFEENPLHIMQALEKEGWLKVLSPHWLVSKVDQNDMAQWMKTRQLLQETGKTVDAGPLAMYFITRRLGEKEIERIQRLIRHREFVESWKAVEENGKELAKRLASKEAATPSRAWRMLASAKPEAVLFLDVTSRQHGVSDKIKNYFGKWRQMQQKLPFPEMAELRITPQLPEYPKIAEEAFLLLLDGKLRNHTEIVKFLKPYEPPPPPPPPQPARRGRKPKETAAAAVPAPQQPRPGAVPAKKVPAVAVDAAKKAVPAAKAPPPAKPAKPEAAKKVAKPAPAQKAAKPAPKKAAVKPAPVKKAKAAAKPAAKKPAKPAAKAKKRKK